MCCPQVPVDDNRYRSELKVPSPSRYKARGALDGAFRRLTQQAESDLTRGLLTRLGRPGGIHPMAVFFFFFWCCWFLFVSLPPPFDASLLFLQFSSLPQGWRDTNTQTCVVRGEPSRILVQYVPVWCHLPQNYEGSFMTRPGISASKIGSWGLGKRTFAGIFLTVC
jgi:hypothetical protein